MDPMEAIRATFFQECDELLGDLESGLLSLQDGTGNDETVNAVFRAVHSVKGGAGAFGLDELVRFAHVFETTLDDVRSGKLPIEPGIVAVLLRAADALADHVTMAKGGPAVDAANAAVIIADLQRFTGADPLSLDAEPDEDIAFVPQKLSLDIDEPQIADPTSPAEWTVTSSLPPPSIAMPMTPSCSSASWSVWVRPVSWWTRMRCRAWSTRMWPSRP